MAAPRVSVVAPEMVDARKSSREAARRRRWNAWLFGIAAALVALILVAPPIPLQLDLDASWQGTLFAAQREGWQFGTELVFTAGPWGWVTSMFVPADAFGARVGCDVVMKLVLVGTIAAAAWPLTAGRRWPLLAGVLLLGGYFPDTLAFLALTMATITWLLPRRASPVAIAWSVLLFAFLAQVKFTFALLAAAAIAISAFAHFVPATRRHAAALAGGFVAAWLGWWLAAGQKLAHLPAYLSTSWEIARGYPQAMSADEPAGVLGWGLAVLGVFGAWALLTLLRERLTRESVLRMGFLAFVWFAAWRHGFTRADGHVNGFFLYAALAGVAITGWVSAPRRYSLLDLALPLGVCGAFAFDAALIGNAWPITVARARDNLDLATHYAARRARHAEQCAAYAAQAKAELGDLATELAGRTVDLLGHDQAGLLLLDAHYAPRPVFQSYSVYTGRLLELNADYFLSDRAPAFVLVRFGSIDGRYPAQDDALALRELAARYEVVRTTPVLTVLRRRPDAATIPPVGGAPAPAFALDPRVPNHAIAEWGQPITLPSPERLTWWLQVDTQLTFFGRLRALLYKPPALRLVVVDEHGREFSHRLVPEAARRGFLIQPLLETQGDVNAFFSRQLRSAVRTVRLEPAAADQKDFWGEVRVTWTPCAELPLRAWLPDDEFRRAGIVDRAAFAIDAAFPATITATPAGPAIQVHAPGAMSFTVPARDREISGRCGISEGAYTNGGATDGAVFAIEVQARDGRRTLLWERTLKPLHDAAAREEQSFKVRLPGDAAVVTLRTSPGTSGNNSWDWTYWREIRFTP